MVIKSKLGQRLVGVFLLGLGCYFTYDELKTVVTEGYYHRAAIIFPAFAVVAVGIIFFPLDYERYKAEHGQESPQGFHQLPDAWKLMTILGIGASLAFWLLLANSHHDSIYPFLFRMLNSSACISGGSLDFHSILAPVTG